MPFAKWGRKPKEPVVEKQAVGYDSHMDAAMLSKAQIKRATRTRMIWSVVTALCLFVAVIFLIMVEIGNTSNKPALRDIWFIRLDLSQVIPTSTPSGGLLNSIAQSLGLYDFYQVGLWNYCEGYDTTGVATCTPTRALYWFDPVEIITSQLLAGASIQLPSDLTNILDIIRIASHWMFGLFLTGACLSFVLIPFVLLGVRSRWLSLFLMIFTALNAIFVIAASVIGTVMFIIMRNVFRNNEMDINIVATIGTTMFALMWVASAFALFAFIIQLCLMCCCASRRDVRKGKKSGSKKAYQLN